MKKGSPFLLFSLVFALISFLIGMLTGRNIHKETATILLQTKVTAAVAETQNTNGIDQGQLININTASKEILDALPGIGPVLAERIIAYRNEHGPFLKTTDLSYVEGIGPQTLLEILDLITVED